MGCFENSRFKGGLQILKFLLFRNSNISPLSTLLRRRWMLFDPFWKRFPVFGLSRWQVTKGATGNLPQVSEPSIVRIWLALDVSDP